MEMLTSSAQKGYSRRLPQPISISPMRPWGDRRAWTVVLCGLAAVLLVAHVGLAGTRAAYRLHHKTQHHRTYVKHKERRGTPKRVSRSDHKTSGSSPSPVAATTYVAATRPFPRAVASAALAQLVGASVRRRRIWLLLGGHGRLGPG